MCGCSGVIGEDVGDAGPERGPGMRKFSAFSFKQQACDTEIRFSMATITIHSSFTAAARKDLKTHAYDLVRYFDFSAATGPVIQTFFNSARPVI